MGDPCTRDRKRVRVPYWQRRSCAGSSVSCIGNSDTDTLRTVTGDASIQTQTTSLVTPKEMAILLQEEN